MAEDSGSLSRDMSLFDITMIGVGAMIGAGIESQNEEIDQLIQKHRS